MKKRIKFTLYMLFAIVVISAVHWCIISILGQFGLAFRQWVPAVMTAILILLVIALVGGIIAILYKAYSLPREQKSKRLSLKILCAFGILAVVIVSAIMGIYGFFFLAFSYQPEHMVNKDGIKMVAYVGGFLEVDVYYYEYKNWIVRGKGQRIYEQYGDGGYDPFKRDTMPVPQSATYYDENGNIVKELEREDNSSPDKLQPESQAQESETKQIEFPNVQMQCEFENTDQAAQGLMRYSVDGGETWLDQQIGYHYQSIFDGKGCMILSYNWAMHKEASAVFATEDGGRTWSYVNEGPSDDLLQKADFMDENTGYFQYGTAGTASYKIYVTKDGGKTFAIADIPEGLRENFDQIKEYIQKNN